MEVLITTRGDDKIRRAFTRFAHNVGDARSAFAAIQESIAKTDERRWGKGAPLADSTIERKRGGENADMPLVRSGALRAELTKPQPHGITPHEMRFGTKLFYARFLQYGTVKMVKHPVLRFGAPTRKLTRELLREHIMRGVR